MKQKTNTKEGKSAKPSAIDLTQMAEKALKNYEQAVQTGVKLQTETTQTWSNLLSQTACPQDWQGRFTNCATMASGMMPAAQKRMEEVLALMQKNGRTGAELMQKAMDATQSPIMADSQAKWMDFWTSSLAAARSNAEALTQLNARAIDSWIEFVQHNSEITQVRVPKTP